MAHIPVQCQNCGARYKIPDTFKSDAAKCKGCGTLIDVKSVRDASGGEDPAPSRPQASTGGTRKPRSTGTRRPRETAEAAAAPARSSSRRSKNTEEAPARGRRAAAGGRSRRGQGEDEGDEGARRYEKKKDNTAMMAGVTIGALVIVGVIAFFMFSQDKKTPDPKEGNEKVAAKNEGSGKEGATADKAPAGENDPAKVAEADATKTEKDPKAADASAKKPTKKKKKKKSPTKKPVAKPAEIKEAKDVYKPLSDLEKLPRPADVTEEEEKEVLSVLDDLRKGSGMAYIRAPAKLEAMGYKILPVVANRLLELDYSKADDNAFAVAITDRVITAITNWTFGLHQSKIADDFKLKDGDENAKIMREIHQHARLFWSSKEAWEKYKKKYSDKFK